MSLGLTSILFLILVPIVLIAWIAVAAGAVYLLRDSDMWDQRGCLISLLIITFPWGLIAYFFLRDRNTRPLD